MDVMFNKHRLPRTIHDDFVVRVQLGRNNAAESERAREILRRLVVLSRAAESKAELPGVLGPENRCVVLEFVVVLYRGGPPDRVPAAIE